MNRARNSEAMRPTRKPMGVVKKEAIEANRLTDYSSSHKKEKFDQQDEIK